MARKIAVRGLAVHKGKLLCVRLKQYGDITKVSEWCLPGGGLDEGESLHGGIEREMIEETGVRPKVGELLYIQQFAHEGRDHLEFFFHITNAQDYLKVDLDKTTHGALEIAEIAYVDPSANDILPVFLATEDLTAKTAASSPATIFCYLQSQSKQPHNKNE